jgi:hypothetical protein
MENLNYKVWADNESTFNPGVSLFECIEAASDYASHYVHLFDFYQCRVILHIEDLTLGVIVETFENMQAGIHPNLTRLERHVLEDVVLAQKENEG